MSADADLQDALDQENAEFWDFVCGSVLAREIGATAHDAASLQKFDKAFMCLYPFLRRYIEWLDVDGRRVLEVGLRYGTVGQKITEAGADYHGLDIASGPVALMNARLERIPGLPYGRAVQGSVLAIPFPIDHF